jgi:plasmid stabilization system protein ParE
MKIRFVDEAGDEFLVGISHYEEQQPGFGRRFKVEVEQTLLWLSEHSEACQLRPGGYRRLNLRIFPYYIPYVVRGSTLWVLAIAHGRRKPEYWIQRKNKTIQ